MKKTYKEGLGAAGVVVLLSLFATGLNSKQDLAICLGLATIVATVISLQAKRINRLNADARKNLTVAPDAKRVATPALIDGKEVVLVEGFVSLYGHSLREWGGKKNRAVLYAKKTGENTYDISSPKLLYSGSLDYEKKDSIFAEVQFLETTTRKIDDEGVLGSIDTDCETKEGVLEYRSVA